jgi:hypothetical protein
MDSLKQQQLWTHQGHGKQACRLGQHRPRLLLVVQLHLYTLAQSDLSHYLIQQI